MNEQPPPLTLRATHKVTRSAGPDLRRVTVMSRSQRNHDAMIGRRAPSGARRDFRSHPSAGGAGELEVGAAHTLHARPDITAAAPGAWRGALRAGEALRGRRLRATVGAAARRAGA